MSSTATTSPPTTLRTDAQLIGLVGLAHAVSYFSQLILAPLFPWLKDAFNVSYTELGAVLTVFFVVSCMVQAASGFIVDKLGPRPVLFVGLGALALAAFGYAMAQSYWMLLLCAVVGGIGNGVFHPVDYTLFNRKVAPTRLGHAYSVHGITGSLGWALAPAFVVPIAIAFSWRVALASAGVVAIVVLLVLWAYRSVLSLDAAAVHKATGQGEPAPVGGEFDFLRIPAVWMCFGFFFYAAVISVVQTFAPVAAGHLHAVPVALVAVCLTVYMVASAGGMVVGGFLASDPSRCERIVGAGFGIAAALALVLAFAQFPPILVPVLFGAMGFVSGVAGPSRDLLVGQALDAAQCHRARLRRGVRGARHRPGAGATGVRPPDGPWPVHERDRRPRAGAGCADCQRLQRHAGAAHGAGAGFGLIGLTTAR